jgi:excinuclease ABC subunit B
MSIVKAVQDVMEGARRRRPGRTAGAPGTRKRESLLAPEQAMKRIKKLEAEMYKHARNLEFEEAAGSATRSRSLRHQAGVLYAPRLLEGRIAQR